MNKTGYFVLPLIACCLLSSCSSKIFGNKKKKHKAELATADSVRLSLPAIPATVNTGVPVATTPAETMLISELAPLWHQRINYKTFTGKAKVSFDGPDGSADFTANFRIAKDSVIWIHISALGGLYPVARMLVTRDSFFLINYKDKERTLIPLADASKILPVAVTYFHLQNLLTGEPLIDGNITTATTDVNTWAIGTEDNNYKQTVTYKKSDSTIILGDLNTRAANGPHALISYSNYARVNNLPVATSRVVNIQNGLKNYTLDMNILNPEFDKELEFPFSIPTNYTLKNQ